MTLSSFAPVVLVPVAVDDVDGDAWELDGPEFGAHQVFVDDALATDLAYDPNHVDDNPAADSLWAEIQRQLPANQPGQVFRAERRVDWNALNRWVITRLADCTGRMLARVRMRCGRPSRTPSRARRSRGVGTAPPRGDRPRRPGDDDPSHLASPFEAAL